MTSFALKLIACVTMLIDHLGASCFYGWGLNKVMVPGMTISVYTLSRIIGRAAFLIYCFCLAEGIRHTRDWRKYLLRLSALALLSELPFDFSLHRLHLLPMQQTQTGFWDSIDWKHQNVYFTLALGLICLIFARLSREWLDRFRQRVSERTGEGEKAARNARTKIAALCALRYAAWGVLTIGLGYFAKYVLHTDYGLGGVVMISIIGLTGEHWNEWFPWMPAWLVNVFFSGLGLYVCCRFLYGNLEKYAAFALIPIAFYRGEKGYSKKAVQIGFYMFYPLHLMGLGFLRYFTIGG